MGTTAALRLMEQVEQLHTIYAIAFLEIAQGADIIGAQECSTPLRQLHEAIRSFISPLHEDRRMDLEIHAVVRWIKQGDLQ